MQLKGLKVLSVGVGWGESSEYEKILKEEKGTKIALAHHKNDNVETFLWNLCRGTGLKGLGGILPVAGEYIRPLLCLKREEIECYLWEKEISYCIDETNLENDYTRNRIRNQMIPYMEENLNVQTVNHIADTIENIRLFNEYINKEVEKYVKSDNFTQYIEAGISLNKRNHQVYY